MRHAGLLFLFVGLTVLASAARAAVSSNDSIVIDGKIIEVQARVRFDSLPQHNSSRSSEFKATWKGAALVGVGQSSEWWHWSGRPDAAFEIEAELLRIPTARDFRKKGGWQAELNVGLVAAALVGIDANGFPDSLIGFLPAERDRPLRFVTSQRFDIGTETDTLDAVTSRTRQVLPFVSAGLAGYWGAWTFGVEAGIQYIAQPWQGRPLLQLPTLEGSPFVPADPRPAGIQPRISYQIAYHVPQSPWHIRWLGVWIPEGPQNHWVGAGVAFDAW